jgi:hypothetical protein
MDEEDVRTIRALLAGIDELGTEVAGLLEEKARIMGELAAQFEATFKAVTNNGATPRATTPPAENDSQEEAGRPQPADGESSES